MRSIEGLGKVVDRSESDSDGGPDLVWKYARLDVATKIINGSRLWFSCPSTFNDPFDCNWNSFWFLRTQRAREFMKAEWSRINHANKAPPEASSDRRRDIKQWLKRLRKLGVRTRDPIPDAVLEPLLQSADPITETVRQSIERSARRVRVCCFSAVCDDLLMWSHYGDHHKGVVIGFRRAEVIAALSREYPQLRHLSGHVNYATDLPEPSDLRRACQMVMCRAQSREDLVELSRIRVFTKAMQWAYEREWRAAVALAVEDQERLGEIPIEVQFGQNAIASVIGGARAPESGFAELQRLAQLRGLSASFERWVAHPSQFALAKRDLA